MTNKETTLLDMDHLGNPPETGTNLSGGGGDVVGGTTVTEDVFLDYTVDDANWKAGIDYSESGRPFKIARTDFGPAGDTITCNSDKSVTMGALTVTDVNGIEMEYTNGSNISIGTDALANTTVQTEYNVAIGKQALEKLTGNFDDNVAIGYASNFTGSNKSRSTAIGSLTSTGSHTNCTAIGFGATGTAPNQVTLGDGVVDQVVPGADVTCDLGSSSKQFKDLYLSGGITIGGSTTAPVVAYGLSSYAIGTGSKSVGGYAVSIGTNAGADSTSDNTVYIGTNAGRYVSTGVNGVAIGFGALKGVSGTPLTGSHNNAVGVNVLPSIQGTATQNTAFGGQSLFDLTTGSGNTAVGYDAGDTVTTGTNNTCLGALTDCAGTLSNQTAVGHQAVCSAANSVVIGNASVTSIGGYTVWSNLSDKRDKKNLVPMTGGLVLLDDINTCEWDWDIRDLRTPKTDKDGVEIDQPPFDPINGKSCGFVAQDLQQSMIDNGVVVHDLIDDSNPERLGIRESKLIPILVNAVKELHTRVKALE